jgi:hypothetical protein
MAKDGAITSEFFKHNLIKALQDYEGEAAKTSDNITAKTRDLQREYELFISMLDEPIGGAANASLDIMAETLGFLRENSELTMAAIALLGARGVVALTNLSAAHVKSANASRLARREDALAAIEAHKLAQAELAAAQASLQKAQAQKAGSLSSVSSLERIKSAQQRLTVAQTQYTQSSKLAAQASAQLSAKTRLLRSAGALIGGPAGVFTLAAVALASFAASARNGSPDIANLKREVDLLLGNHATIRQEELNASLNKSRKVVQKLAKEYRTLAALTRTGRTAFGQKDKEELLRRGKLLETAREQVRRLEEELNNTEKRKKVVGTNTGSTLDPREKIIADQQEKALARQQQLSQQAFARLEYDLLSEEEKIISSYEKRKQIILDNTADGSAKREQLLRDASGRYIEELRQLYDQEKALEDDKNRAVVASAKQAGEQKRQALYDSMQSMGQIFGNMSQILMDGNKKQFEQGKKMAQAEAAISGSLAFIKALTAGPILGPILAGTIATMTAIQMTKINQKQYQPVAHGGMTYNPDERSVTITKGERVVSPRQNQDLMGFLNQQNNQAGFGKNQLVQNFSFQSFDPASAAQIVKSIRGNLGSMAMKKAG